MNRPLRLHAMLVLLGGVAFTALTVAVVVVTAFEHDRHVFESAAHAAQDTVVDRVETSVALLRGAAGLFASAGRDVDVASFAAYMRRVGLREHYPGILGVGFSRRILPGEREALEQAMRRQGHPAFRVWPDHPREEWHSIVFLEPLDARNAAAIGYDMYTNEIRRAAMARARDTGQSAASGVVELVQEIDDRKQPGFLIYLPVYEGEPEPGDVDGRRERLLGFVYSPIRAGDFLSSAFSHQRDPGVALAVYHGNDAASPALLYEHGAAIAPSRPLFNLQTTVDVAGQPWTFVFRSTTTLAQALIVPLLLSLAGVALALTLAALLWRESSNRAAIHAALDRELAARSQAERANRMKDDFLATLSHELRTPLSAIVGWAAVLKRGSVGTRQLRDGIDAIDRNARAQARLIDDLLDVNRIVSGKLGVELATVAIAEVLDDALATIVPAAQAKGLALERRDLDEGVLVRADHARLRQVFGNLLTNAVKFTPPGGRIDVVLEADGDIVRVSVSDTGEGIEPALLDRIFERFTQADSAMSREHAGLGLGLAIARELVALHGGSVRAQSAGRGQGATFIVELPRLAASASSAGETEARPAGGTMLHGVRVLVVDDEPDVRQLLQRVLEQRAAVVACAASAEEALERLDTFEPDVIVSDIGMPGVTGYELMRRIRARPPDRSGLVPAAALTAYARPQDRDDALRAGFDQHLTKPMQPEALVHAVAALATTRPRHRVAGS